MTEIWKTLLPHRKLVQCPGVGKVPLRAADEGFWYAVKREGKDITICEPCMLGMQTETLGEHHVVKHSDHPENATISCDSWDVLPERLDGVVVPGFPCPPEKRRIRIRNAHTKRVLPLLKPQLEGDNGGVFSAPTHTPYEIEIDIKSEEGYAWRILDARVGDRKVHESESLIYHRSLPVTFNGFVPRGHDSFLFKSMSSKEREKEGGAPEGYNKRNIIIVKLQRYIIEDGPLEDFFEAHCEHFVQSVAQLPPFKRTFSTSQRPLPLGGGDRSAGSSGGFSLSAPPLQLGVDLSNMYFSAGDAKEGVAPRQPTSKFHGGTTVSGGEYVKTPSHPHMVTTNRFRPVGDPVTVTMQIVCWQPAEKIETYNILGEANSKDALFDGALSKLRGVLTEYPSLKSIVMQMLAAPLPSPRGFLISDLL